jgi:hypothetical protein
MLSTTLSPMGKSCSGVGATPRGSAMKTSRNNRPVYVAVSPAATTDTIHIVFLLLTWVPAISSMSTSLLKSPDV